MTRSPYPHQDEALAGLRASLKAGHKRPLLQAPTGFGKTYLAALIVKGALAKGNRVIFTCPAISLIDQTRREFMREGIKDIGVLQADHPETDPARPVQVCSVQTLGRRKIPEASVVIIDEAHRVHRFVIDWMRREEWRDVPFIGLTATPWTKGLGKLYDDLIIASTTGQLIREGFLAPFKAFAPAHPDLTGVKTVAGDYHEGQLSAAMQKKTLVGDIVTTWKAKAEGRPTFVFAVDCAHARAIQRQFQDARIECDYLDAKSSREEREACRRRFAMFECQVVVNVGVLTTGIDWDVRCIILARPTKSEILYVQMIGRGLRKALGKDELLILDHSDTTLRLGFVTDIAHEHLDAGETKAPSERKAPLPHECKACAYLMPPGTWKCPACGHEPERLANIATVSGEIVELAERAATKRNRSEGWAEKVAWISGLRAYQRSSGKKDGWVAHAYKERYGVWPNDPAVRFAPAAAITPPDVASWIRSRQIAWAHRKDRGAA